MLQPQTCMVGDDTVMLSTSSTIVNTIQLIQRISINTSCCRLDKGTLLGLPSGHGELKAIQRLGGPLVPNGHGAVTKLLEMMVLEHCI